jgi:O-acetylhomoserine sulfhydrylase
MGSEKLGFDTLKVRGGYDPKEHNNAVSVPIYQTAAFELGDTERAARLFSFSEASPIYTRIANPTVGVLEQRVAALDGAAGAVATGSGMAAVSYTLLNVAGKGGRILTTARLYGGTVDSFNKIYPDFGIAIDVAEDPDDPRSFEKAIRPETKAIFVESISNPNSTVSDLEALAQVAHSHGIPLIVDNTLATPYLLRPFQFGADIIVYSATKALTGHGNVIAGLVLESGKFDWANGKFPQFEQPLYFLRDSTGKERSILEVFPQTPFTGRIRAIYLNYLGAALGPFDAYLVLLGLETLSERVSKQVENTEKIIRYLESEDRVSWVKHPYAAGSPYRALAEKYLPKGAGSVLTFGFKGSGEQYDRFLNSVRLFSYHANIGDARSLIINSPKTTHGELTPEQQKQAGLAPETIRLSIGLEDADDLIADLEQAFDRAFSDENH